MNLGRPLVLSLATAFAPALCVAASPADEVSNAGGVASNDRPVAPAGAQVVAASDSSSVSIKVSRVVSAGATPTPDGTIPLTFTTASATLSAPLTKGENFSTLATLDGLGANGAIEFGFSQFKAGWAPVTGSRLAEETKAKNAICARAREVAKRSNAKLASEDGCDNAEIQQYLGAGPRVEYDRLGGQVIGNGSTIWGFTAKLGLQNSDYVDASVPSKRSQSDTPWSIGAFYAYNPIDSATVWMLNLKYQKKFKAQDNGTVCPLPGAGQVSVTCLTGAVGAPIEVTSKLISIEMRQRFGGYAVAAIITRDFSQKLTGVELPMYFVADKDGKLSAGLKLGWRSDKDQATFGLFVGIPFVLID